MSRKSIKQKKQLTLLTTYSPHFFFMQRFVPSGPTRSTMKYEVYRNKNSSDEDFQTISAMYRRIMSEDKYLCINAQKNINAGVFVNGEMHPTMEKGPLFFQTRVREAVQEHFKREKDANHKIWPAQQRLPKSALVSQTDIDFCAAVDGCGKENESIAW